MSYEDAEAYASKLKIDFLETSAKNAENVEKAFLTMASNLIKIRQVMNPNSAPVRFVSGGSPLNCAIRIPAGAWARCDANDDKIRWVWKQEEELLCLSSVG